MQARFFTSFLLLRYLFGLTLLFAANRLPAADEDARRAEDLSFFETKIRPVLENSCKSCHGPKIAESDLRLDSAAALKTGGAVHGPAVVPGKPDESPLYKAITYKIDDLKMPPKPGPLGPEVVADFRRWIERGAAWPAESKSADAAKKFDLADRKTRLPWIWQPPAPQPVPATRQADWVRNPVDAFILQQLEKAGLKPAADTDEITWLRRATLVLTGLPPTTAEVDAFVADQSPQKREKALDRLLASPAYGERWARHWMDLVRYAESRGHEGDYTIANAWRYRDYLIQAFNDDLPYDQFVREHLAGDLLDQPRVDPKTGANLSIQATAWPFLGEEVHSPVDIRADETDRMDNKIDVFGKTFLGLTIACARCHDHKFDAISQKDYYAMAGFFQGSTYRQAPFATMQADRETARQFENLRVGNSAEVQKIVADSAGFSPKELLTFIHDQANAPQSQNAKPLKQEALASPEHPLNSWVRLAEMKPGPDRAKRAAELLAQIQPGPGQNSNTKIRQTILNFEAGQNGGWAVDGPAFGSGPVPAGRVKPPVAENASTFQVQQRAAAVVDVHFAKPRIAPGHEPESNSMGHWLRASGTGRTQKFTLQTGQLQFLVKGRLRIFTCVASHYMMAGPLHGRLVMELKADGDQPRWVRQDLSEYIGQRVVVEVSPLPDQPGELYAIVETESAEPPVNPPVLSTADRQLLQSIAKEPTDETLTGWLNEQWRELARSMKSEKSGLSNRSAAWLAMIGRNPELVGGLSTQIQPVLNQWNTNEKKIAATIAPHAPLAPALVDLNPIDENVLLRGGWRRPGPVAHRNVPDAFGAQLSLSSSGSGRLELAQSLTRPDQPLLARVWVNRLWQHVFGRGIVPTPDNFGILGMRPSHAELLDYLATTFVSTDQWSTKTALKRLLLSHTFAQTSHLSDSATETADPENILLHRANLQRVEAEVIRDSILAVSGRLDRTLYGPGVPVHLTEFIIGRGRPGASGPLDGAGRRSIYTTVRRNFLPTLLVAFDLPSPFSTVGRRNATNVPAQALALANDPFVLEQAHFWADRELREQPNSTDAERLDRMFRSALARPARPDETRALGEALIAFRAERKLEDQAKADANAWADVAHLLFSLNEFRYLP